ncbi:hypothetical protein UCRPC4_g06622 [Phaeomoniella chlamydospora]|uniref:Mediator of RNA polymerase II transcription subunit 4 n=1 Tax=Phaeomoniella chlamydospora TaxID=158046 RepID=A0A0G2DWA0_PHACM|nr:hypothetical protein UCRPC4_g06622 [Phaeomoniella chlamydospora]
MDAIIHAPLSSVDSSLTTLISSLQASPTYTTAPAATQSLLSADDELTSALELLATHQQNYARILCLRAEATELEEKVKSLVRKANEFRKGVVIIAPGLLDEDSDDEDEGARDQRSESYRDIPYSSLLTFARGIGKYNAEAAKEAEQHEQRLRIESTQKSSGQDATGSRAEVVVNGISTTTNGVKSDLQPLTAEAKDPEAASKILERAAGWLNQTSEERKNLGALSFPSGERLRRGILGQLQAIQEEHGGGEKGDLAVEREIERMIAIAEGRQVAPKMEDEGTRDMEMGGMGVGTSQEHKAFPGQPSATPQVKDAKKTLNLDLWDESDEE